MEGKVLEFKRETPAKKAPESALHPNMPSLSFIQEVADLVPGVHDLLILKDGQKKLITIIVEDKGPADGGQ